MTVERREGPTPAGGAYSEAIYVDGRLVEIVEYDESGLPLVRTYVARVVATPRSA